MVHYVLVQSSRVGDPGQMTGCQAKALPSGTFCPCPKVIFKATDEWTHLASDEIMIDLHPSAAQVKSVKPHPANLMHLTP